MTDMKKKIAALEKDAEPCAKLGISRADTATPCIGYAENKRTNEMCEMCRGCKSSRGYQDVASLKNPDAVQRAIRHFQCMADDAKVVLDSGFGTHPGESDLVYRNRKLYAELAVAALKRCQPERYPIPTPAPSPWDWSKYPDGPSRDTKEKANGQGKTQRIGLVLRRDVQTGIDEYTPVYKTVYVEVPDDGNHWQVVGQTEDTFL